LFNYIFLRDKVKVESDFYQIGKQGNLDEVKRFFSLVRSQDQAELLLVADENGKSDGPKKKQVRLKLD